MTENALLHLCVSQDRLIAVLLDEFMEGDDPAGRASQIEKLIPFLIDNCRDGVRALESLRSALFFKKIKKTQMIGVITWDYLPRVISRLVNFQRFCRRARESGWTSPRYAEFEEALDKFRKASEDFLAKWPWVDWVQVAVSNAAYERGEFREAKEALDELFHQATQRKD